MHDESYNAGSSTAAGTTAEPSQIAMDVDDAAGLDLSPRLRYVGSQDREALGGMGAQDRATGRTEPEPFAGDSDDGPDEPQLDHSQGVGENHSRPRGEMPKLSAISLAWEEMGSDELRGVFPDLRCFGIGWAEPFCFRCGWLAPVEAADYPEGWSPERAVNAAWDASTGWLERAHLHDHRFGGEEDALNLAPLCPLCHEQQPFCRTREEGIAFVNEGADMPVVMGAAVQMVTDHFYRDIRRPGKEKAVRSLWRARPRLAAVAAIGGRRTCPESSNDPRRVPDARRTSQAVPCPHQRRCASLPARHARAGGGCREAGKRGCRGAGDQDALRGPRRVRSARRIAMLTPAQRRALEAVRDGRVTFEAYRGDVRYLVTGSARCGPVERVVSAGLAELNYVTGYVGLTPAGWEALGS